MSLNILNLSVEIKQKAKEFGFDECGFAKAEKMDAEAKYLEAWLNQQKHGSMYYMANNFDKRVDPRLLVDNAQTVISLSYNYFTKQTQNQQAPKVAMYAFGTDYHKVVKDKLFLLLAFIKSKVGEVNARCFVDSAPVLERAWAMRSGIGWAGKNTNLLTKKRGSFFFLAEIILDVKLVYDSPVKDYCGNCTKCIDACPTQAITAPYQLDGSKCISYFTIENKDEFLPEKLKGKFENWLYGCDICQQVCPINSQAKEHTETMFAPITKIIDADKNDWENMTDEEFNILFKNSPIKRTGLKNIKRNLKHL